MGYVRGLGMVAIAGRSGPGPQRVVRARRLASPGPGGGDGRRNAESGAGGHDRPGDRTMPKTSHITLENRSPRGHDDRAATRYPHRITLS